MIEAIVRTSYGRLLAWLAARAGDVAAAEDALADAFAAALVTWPRTGVPDRPEAWLLAAARNRLTDGARHHRVRAEAAAALLELAEQRAEAPSGFPDERLALLFVCAHPAIDAAARTPLMLQSVLGLDAARIAAAFLETPAAVGQRLSRAKAKIRATGIRFAVPEPPDLPERLPAVLAAIYAAFTAGWNDGADAARRGLVEEGIFLARVLVQHLPEHPEARGLLSLMLLAAARAPARRDAQGRFVPLAEQDPARWLAPLMTEGMAHLAQACAAGQPGRYQLEAAIQALHCTRPPDWAEIALLYQGLLAHAPTIGARVGHAAATAEAQGPAEGLALLEGIEGAAAYQPFWAVRAHIQSALGQDPTEAARHAIALAPDPAVGAWLAARYRIA